MSDNGGDTDAEIDEEEPMEEVDALAMEAIRQALLDTTLEIGRMGDAQDTFTNARSVVKLSQGNDTVKHICLYLYVDSYRDHKMLHILGEGVGNLKALQEITIIQVYARRDMVDDDHAEREEATSLYWQAFASVLGQVCSNQIELHLTGNFLGGINYTHFAAAIQGVSTIQYFQSDPNAVPRESVNTLMLALASLPSLVYVELGSFGFEEPGDCRGLTDLLKSPSLQYIEFCQVHFTRALSHAVLAGFEEGSFVAKLTFSNCSLGNDGDTILALLQALQRASSVKNLYLNGNHFHELFYEGITTVLVVNTNLVHLDLHVRPQEGTTWLLTFFNAMRTNTSLKCLAVEGFRLTDNLLCGALRDALAKNTVLESLALTSHADLCHTGVVSWRNALPFIRDNATLKSLTISFHGTEYVPHIATLCFDTVAMLESNTTLECLDIHSKGIGPDAYFAALESLRPSSTLKTLRLSPVRESFGNDEMNRVVSLVKKNYFLTALDYSLTDLDVHFSRREKTGELDTLLRLNQAGRRYLIEDATSIARGVEVLIDVRNDLGCLFYHLLENPTLCDIEHQYGTKLETAGRRHQRTSN
jgi:hypothetical protein